jgi:predicted ferric reductase
VGNGGPVAYRSYGGSKQLNTSWQSVTWDIARAGGFTAYILLTLAVIVGLALSTQIQSPSRWPRLLNSELHNFLTLLSTIFLVVHILAVWIDPFTHFGLNEILIPLASSYRPIWMALGIVGLYLGIAIGISTLLRPHIGYKLWRKLHVLTLGVFALATIHGIGTGSDTQTQWALGIYLVSSILVGSLLCRRLFLLKRKNKTARAHTITPNRSARATEARIPEQKSLPRSV